MLPSVPLSRNVRARRRTSALSSARNLTACHSREFTTSEYIIENDPCDVFCHSVSVEIVFEIPIPIPGIWFIDVTFHDGRSWPFHVTRSNSKLKSILVSIRIRREIFAFKMYLHYFKDTKVRIFFCLFFLKE